MRTRQEEKTYKVAPVRPHYKYLFKKIRTTDDFYIKHLSCFGSTRLLQNKKFKSRCLKVIVLWPKINKKLKKSIEKMIKRESKVTVVFLTKLISNLLIFN